MKNLDVEFLDHPVEIFILRDGKTLMSQVFRHTPIRFGRILENDIVLPFEGVSRHHCVMYFREGKWNLEDLKSLNGVEVNGQRVATATFDAEGSFELAHVTIQVKAARPLEATLTTTRFDPLLDATIDHDKTFILPQEPSVSLHGKTPMLNADGIALLSDPHQSLKTTEADSSPLAVQVTIAWYEVILAVEEFIVGEDMIVEFNGIRLRLGRVSEQQADVRCPTGTSFLDFPAREATMQPGTVTVWVADDGLRIFARYVPQSKRPKTSLIPDLDGELIDPLVYSGVAHGAVALASLTMTIQPAVMAEIPPVRMAKIITQAPRPSPQPATVARPVLLPTPTPVMPEKTTHAVRPSKSKRTFATKLPKRRFVAIAKSSVVPTKPATTAKPQPPAKTLTLLKVEAPPLELAPASRRVAAQPPQKTIRRVIASVLTRATFRELNPSDGLTLEQVIPVVQSYDSQIQLCYNRNLSENADLIGRAELQWQIGANGKVVPNSVRFKELTPKNASQLFDCLKAAFRKMKFPRSTNSAPTNSTIGLPLGGL